MENFELQKSNGEKTHINEYEGKLLLVVNTASKCGFTPQYEGLEELHEKYHQKGLEILAFPCNQFGAQEPGSDSEISDFCKTEFGAQFTVFSKTEVNGDHAHPLYQWLKQQAPGLLGHKAIKWNFTKFLVKPDRSEVKRFAPTKTPASLTKDLESWLP